MKNWFDEENHKINVYFNKLIVILNKIKVKLFLKF